MKSILPDPSSPLVRRLWRDYIRTYLRLILATIVLLLIISGTTSLQPIMLQLAFDKVFEEKNTTYLTLLPVAIVVVCVVQSVASYYSIVLMSRFGNGITADMRKKLFEQIVNNEIEFYSNYDAGNLLARVTSEILSISNSIQLFFNTWARQVITSLGLIGVMFYESVELSLIAMFSLTFAFYPVFKITRRLKKVLKQAVEKNTMFNSRLLESFQGIRVIKAFAKEDFEVKKIGYYISEIENVSNKTTQVASLTAPIMQILGGVAVAFVIWYGGYQLLHDRMTKGNLIAFIGSLLWAYKPIRSVTSAGNVITAGLVNAERYYKILDSKPKYESRDHGVKINITSGGIAFDKVSFEYPNGTQALKNVSFTIDPGKKTALVGHSGSGKSTVFNLLLKFYEPTSGTVRIDSQDISGASINSLRGSIALVSQDIFIFDETARNNIGYGKANATEEEIIAASKAAKCHDFIMSLPQGYDTELGFLGQNLSGGQKQRIAIARAFLRNAPILLLDEATSSLDPKTEAEIQESLESLTKNRTTIIIAHRLSTVMNTDKMVLMRGGMVEGVGTHEELLRSSQSYKDLFGI